MRVVLITGGARSGKSDYAMSLAENSAGKMVYIATATSGDPEMAERIRKHKEARGPAWRTVEEPLDILESVQRNSAIDTAVVLDCLTLWLTNIMMRDGEGFEPQAGQKSGEFVEALQGLPGTLIVVTNETGMGIVPDNAVARRFRDAAGMVNSTFAQAADDVYFMVSGIPVKVK